MSVGHGGIFCNELKSALYGLSNPPHLHSVIAGLGGRDVTPEDVKGMVDHVVQLDHPSETPIFWGLKE
jgi:pyruvate/2-oxoacid:ferredoxin oxidoreductase alpha subunit